MDELERDEVENKRAILQATDDNVFAKLDPVDELVVVEGDLGAALALVAVPDDEFVALLRVHKNNNV